MTASFIVVIALVLVALILPVLFQRRFIYQRRSSNKTPHLSLQSIGGEVIEIKTSDGERLVAWHRSPPAGRPIVVFFHGSADSPNQRAVRFLGLVSAQFGILAPHFRGYGGSTGHPSEKGLALDADAIYRYCNAHYRPEQIVLWGFSLGSAVAVSLASKKEIAALVLEAAFTSLADVAKNWVPFLPSRFILRDRFQADQAIKSVKAPILMIHGGSDRDVPLDLGKRLFESAPEPKQLVVFDAAGHDDLDQYGAIGDVRRFLAESCKDFR